MLFCYLSHHPNLYQVHYDQQSISEGGRRREEGGGRRKEEGGGKKEGEGGRIGR